MPVTATGPRDTTVVVQGYVAPVDPPVTRPLYQLRQRGRRREHGREFAAREQFSGNPFVPRNENFLLDDLR